MARIIILVLTVLMGAGCSTAVLNGAPKMNGSAQENMKIVESRLQLAEETKKYANDSIATRNAIIDSQIIVANANYVEFITSLGADKRSMDAAIDISQLFISVAGTLVGGIQSKENLAAAASLIGGTKIAVDKHFYFNQTLPALITSMNNRRKEILLRIISGRRSNIQFYPTISAISDIDEYIRAGTLSGAIEEVQSQASQRQAVLDSELKLLLPATKAEVNRLTVLITKIKSLESDPSSLNRINAILKGVGSKKSDYVSQAEAYKKLVALADDIQPSDLPTWEQAFQSN